MLYDTGEHTNSWEKIWVPDNSSVSGSCKAILLVGGMKLESHDQCHGNYQVLNKVICINQGLSPAICILSHS